MKSIKLKSILVLSTLFFVLLSSGQAPQAINYQAVVRNGNGIVVNRPITVQFQVHDTGASGPVVYKEFHNISTNSHGLFSAKIGEGNQLGANDFFSIDWANGKKFLQVGIDTTGAFNFTYIDTLQLISVPYALHANHADTAKYAQSSTPQTLSYDTATHTLSLSSGGSLTLNDLVPAGTIVAYGGEVPPAGWFECNGDTLLIAAYPRLSAAISNNWGNPSTGYFNLPDLRGNFMRGWSHNSNHDPDASGRQALGGGAGGHAGNRVGSFQMYELQSHNHTQASHNHTLHDPGHSHDLQYWTQTLGGGPWKVGSPAPGAGGFNINPSSLAGTGFYTSTNSTNITLDSATPSINSTGGSETRPKNLNVMYIIKY